MDAQQAFHRPPRDYPTPVPKERLRLAPPPTEPVPPHTSIIQTLFPVVGGVGILGFALVYRNSAFLYVALGMIVLLLGFSLLMRWSQKRGVRKRAAEEARRYAAYLREQEQELARSGDLQRAALARLYPDPGALWTAVIKRDGVWERRPDDEDFLHVRLGRGVAVLDREVELDLGFNPLTEYQPHPLQEARRLVERRGELRNQPVVTDLSGVGILAVTGDRPRARAWSRSLIAQLAAFRSPHDVRILASLPPDAREEWAWCKWLPHARVETRTREDDVPVPAVALAHDATELEALLEPELGPRVEQLRRLEESERAGRPVGLVEPELLVFVDGYAPGHDANRVTAFRDLLERPRSLRALVVLLCDDRSLEPSAIDARLKIPARGPARYELADRDAEVVDDLSPDALDVGTSEALARSLTPLKLAEGGGERGLGDTVRLVDLLGLESAAALDPAAAAARRPRRASLRVPIGVGADGEVVELDLKQAAEDGMGPHGILVGATGSGKSELLRSAVAGLAVTHAPEDLAFVLVDYKGGAAFAELARLPHVAGLITNLQSDLSLVDRMHAALQGEQQRRQAVLREAGNLDDVVAYRARRDADPGLAPLPDLLVVVDEFAELLQAKPEFIDLFVAIGRVGRSLGIHLLLSSQRLDEGRLRGLESHLRYRLCLRTYSASESKLVLGTPDAYLMPSLPGLGYLKVDTSVYSQFRAALVSSPYAAPEVPSSAPVAIRTFEADSRTTVAAVAPEPGHPGPEAPTDLEVLISRVEAGRDPGAPAVHQVWVDPLPDGLALSSLEADPPWWADDRGGAATTLAAPVALRDRPTEQRTEAVVLDLAGAGGSVSLVGAPRTGKSTFLRTLVAGLARRHTPTELRVYAIDLGGGLLAALEGLPHVGGVVGKLDPEAIHRVVAQLTVELEEREERFRRLGIESMAEARALRARGSEEDLADVLLVVDGWDAFKRAFEGLDRALEPLAAAGLAFGLHVVVTATRWAEIRPALLDNLGTRLELKLNDAIDSAVSRAESEALAADVAGRGLGMDGLQIQLALPRVDGADDADGLGAALGELVQEVAGHWRGPAAEPIRTLPRLLSASELPPPSREGIPVGVEERRLEPAWIDLFGGDPHLLVFGDAETGKSSLVRCLAQGLEAAFAPEEVRLHVADVRRSLPDLAEGPHVASYSASAMVLQDVATRLAAELAGDRGERPSRHVLLVDDYDLLSGPASSPLAPLLDLLALGRDLGLHVVLTRRVGGSARGQYESVFGRVRELGSPGILLSGDAGEGPLLAGVKAAVQPPGRGLLVERGRPPVAVQLALVPAPESGANQRPVVSSRTGGP